MASSMIKALSKLQLRQFVRGNRKKTAITLAVGILYFWVIEAVIFFMLKDEGIDCPPVVFMIICSSFLGFDFIFKLLTVRDETVMDSFIKTRPIAQSDWDRFLSVSQFWKMTNLEMPVSLLPACFLFIPFLWGLLCLTILYLASVFGGFMVMLIKHRGTYQPEKPVSVRETKPLKSSSGRNIFGIQTRSLVRSKRLKRSVIYLGVIFYLNAIIYSFNDMSDFNDMFKLYFVMFLSMCVPQWGFSVEANFFNGIWTRPVSIKRLLTDKYLLGFVISAGAALLCVPICLWSHASVTEPFAYALFSAGFANLVFLADAYNCVALDLFGKSFFNYQGSSSTFKATTFIALILIFSAAIFLPSFLPGWKSQVLLSVLGLAGIAFHCPFFGWVEKRFMENRYKYMEKYNSI